MILFYISSFLFGLFLVCFASLFQIGIHRNFDFCEQLLRLKYIGTFLGMICLCWSAWHGCIMLEGGLAKYRIIIWLLVPLGTLGGFFWLDYLFARSVGGIMVLTVNYLLHAAFIQQTFFRCGYSFICLVWGVIGLYLIGAPWYLRELMAKAAKNKKLRIGIVLFCVVSAVCLILQPLIR